MQPQEYKAWESVYAKYVPWDLFGFSECTQWSEVPAVWMGEYLTKEQCKDQFPGFKDWENVTFAQAKTSSSSADLDDSMQQPPSTTTFGRFGTGHAHLSGVLRRIIPRGRSHARKIPRSWKASSRCRSQCIPCAPMAPGSPSLNS